MTVDLDIFSFVKPYIRHDKILIGDIKFLSFRQVKSLYTQKIDPLLLKYHCSLRQKKNICCQFINSATIEFHSSDFCVKDKQAEKELLMCTSKGTSLYPLSSKVASIGNKSQLAIVASTFSCYLWHRRLGHPSWAVLANFVKENKIFFDFPSKIDLSLCNACEIEKYVKLSFQDPKLKSAHPFWIVHSDVRQAHANSISNYKNYVLFVQRFFKILIDLSFEVQT